MMILMKRENLIKGTQSYEYIVSIIFKDKMQVPTALLFVLIIQGSPLSLGRYFWFEKCIAFSTIRNCMYKRELWNLDLSIYL